MLPELLAALEQAGERSAVRSILRRHRVAYVGGLAAAAAAGAAGAVVIAARNRRARPSLAADLSDLDAGGRRPAPWRPGSTSGPDSRSVTGRVIVSAAQWGTVRS